MHHITSTFSGSGNAPLSQEAVLGQLDAALNQGRTDDVLKSLLALQAMLPAEDYERVLEASLRRFVEKEGAYRAGSLATDLLCEARPNTALLKLIPQTWKNLLELLSKGDWQQQRHAQGLAEHVSEEATVREVRFFAFSILDALRHPEMTVGQFLNASSDTGGPGQLVLGIGAPTSLRALE